MSTEPGGTRVQVGAATLRVSAAVFSAYFHSPCGCFDAFAAPEAVCVWGSYRVSPFNLTLKLKVSQNATLTRELGVRSAVLDGNCVYLCGLNFTLTRSL